MAFGGLGVSLAGFAGIIATLRRPAAEDAAVAAYRIRTIVFLGFCLTFVGFGTVALYAVTTGDLALTVRVSSALLAIPFLRGLLVDTRPGPVWPLERQRQATIVVLFLMLGATLGNVIIGSVAYLQVMMLVGLIGPVSIFYATIVDATRPSG